MLPTCPHTFVFVVKKGNHKGLKENFTKDLPTGQAGTENYICLTIPYFCSCISINDSKTGNINRHTCKGWL